MSEADKPRRLTVSKVELTPAPGGARVFLSDGSELWGLTMVRPHEVGPDTINEVTMTAVILSPPKGDK